MKALTRYEKARTLAKGGFVHILRTDSKGRAIEAYIPGSAGKRYHVIIRRNNNDLTAECRVDVGAHGYKRCPSTKGGRVCYHALALVVASAEANAHETAICATKDIANRTLRLWGDSGVVYTITPFTGGHELYILGASNRAG